MDRESWEFSFLSFEIFIKYWLDGEGASEELKLHTWQEENLREEGSIGTN